MSRELRAPFIRELVADGLSNAEIRARCIAESIPEPSPQAIYRARTFAFKGRRRPSYQFLWAEYLSEYRAAVARGVPIAITASLKEIAILAEAQIEQDKKPKPKRKRSPVKKRKPKPKAQP